MTKKAIGLLELTISDTDIRLSKSFSFFWTQTPIFNRFPIVDIETGTGSTVLEKTLFLLNKYYNEGFRIFVGFNRSTILAGCISWFESHPDAICVSVTSASDSLSFPKKNIYRLANPNQTVVDSLNVYIQPALDAGGKIYYVYSKDEVATENFLSSLIDTYGAENIISFPANPDSSNITVSNLETFYSDCTTVDIAIVYLINGVQQDTYISRFNNFNGLDLPLNQYDITFDNIPYIGFAITTLQGKYYVLVEVNVTSSSLINLAISKMGNQYINQSLNALYLVTNLVNNISINNIYSYNNVLQFNENNDLKYYNYAFYKYNTSFFFELHNLISEDPIYGVMNFDIVE